MLPEVKKITDYIKKLDNKSPYSEKYGIESSSKAQKFAQNTDNFEIIERRGVIS